MIEAFIRKSSQLVGDPVLRRWLTGRMLGRYGGVAKFTPGRPPYLAADFRLTAAGGPATGGPGALDGPPPNDALSLPLPGRRVTVQPDAPGDLYTYRYDDTETLLAVHRFAWLPLLGDAAEPGWVDVLWREWVRRFRTVDQSWAWHPYTAAERAINIIDFAERQGIPGDAEETLKVLAAHGPAIADRLEYFGEHNTSNHLSNNGRALYLLGLALGREDFTDFGLRILIAEAGRIFAPSGVLREGSSHYHLLLARNYADAWLAARRRGRDEAGTLADVTRRALEVLPHLMLPGGMPLVGDISPDCPPGFLSGLLPGGDMNGGWCGLRSSEDRDALEALKDSAQPVSPGRLAADGWVRTAAGQWTALWHTDPAGWAPMPGHAHQDIGAFEVHFDDIPLFIDPGRGAYGETGEATAFVTATAHNGLTVDGADPFPPNKPYYSDSFRGQVAGPPPRVTRTRNGIAIAHDGFSRLRGIGEVSRQATWDGNAMIITDRIEGARSADIVRRLITPLPVSRTADGLVIDGGAHRFKVTGDGEITLETGKRWVAYGISEPATVIAFSETARLPARLAIRIEAARR